jgi:hypothetical protein
MAHQKIQGLGEKPKSFFLWEITAGTLFLHTFRNISIRFIYMLIISYSYIKGTMAYGDYAIFQFVTPKTGALA